MKSLILRKVAIGVLLVGAGLSGEAAPWNPPAGFREKAALAPEKRWPESDWLGADGLEFSPDGKLLVAFSGRSANFYIWDVAREKVVAALPNRGAMAAAFSPDGKMLAVCDRSKYVYLWDVANYKSIAKLRGDIPVYWARFSTDGKTLLVAEKWGVTVWDVEKRKELRGREMPSRPLQVSAYLTVKRPLVAILEGVRHANFHPVPLIDAFTGESVLTLAGHKGILQGVTLDREETMVATTAMDQTTRLWNRTTGAAIAVFEHSNNECLWPMFSPDGTILACVTVPSIRGPDRFKGDGFRLYEVPSGKILAESQGSRISAVAFSPDGRLLATAHGDGSGLIRLWSIPAAWRKKK